MNKIILYCRPGFEKECAIEIMHKASKKRIFGYTKTKDYSGYVIFESNQTNYADQLIQKISFSSLIFSRQMFVSIAFLNDLPIEDRVTPIITKLKGIINQSSSLHVEMADTNESKKLMKFCRKLSTLLDLKLNNAGILTEKKTIKQEEIVVHIFFISSQSCYVGYSLIGNNSPFYMGIPRLKLPANAPSRSTLKLEEAFHIFIPKNEWDKRLASGMHAVDLGACPGGWTYQLVKRNMQVYSVDNGQIAQNLIETGKVIWLRENGFHFRPIQNNIFWLVCDIVEKPAKISSLILKWLVNCWCCETIFSLKLPMKKRYEEVLKNLTYIQKYLDYYRISADIQAHQLYHNRKEVTVHIRRW